MIVMEANISCASYRHTRMVLLSLLCFLIHSFKKSHEVDTIINLTIINVGILQMMKLRHNVVK